MHNKTEFRDQLQMMFLPGTVVRFAGDGMYSLSIYYMGASCYFNKSTSLTVEEAINAIFTHWERILLNLNTKYRKEQVQTYLKTERKECCEKQTKIWR